jgi:hypothetical protein
VLTYADVCADPSSAPLDPQHAEVEEEVAVVVSKSTADLEGYVWVRGKVWGVVTGADHADADGDAGDTYEVELSVTDDSPLSIRWTVMLTYADVC